MQRYRSHHAKGIICSLLGHMWSGTRLTSLTWWPCIVRQQMGLSNPLSGGAMQPRFASHVGQFNAFALAWRHLASGMTSNGRSRNAQHTWPSGYGYATGGVTGVHELWPHSSTAGATVMSSKMRSRHGQQRGAGEISCTQQHRHSRACLRDVDPSSLCHELEGKTLCMAFIAHI